MELTEFTDRVWALTNGRPALIFERKKINEYRFTIDGDLQNSLKERNSDNKLYLSTAANWNYDKVKPVFEWFASCQIITKNSIASAYGIEAEALRDDDYRKAIAAMLRVADFGIQSIGVKEGNVLQTSGKNQLGTFANIEATHSVKNVAGEEVTYTLNMTEESDGTKLLDLDLLRRDQIWFTEKDENSAATELFSLYDFSVRKDAKIEKGYLIGRYGAIPFIKGGLI
ncbi:MAG: hypothetical protein PHV18_05670 [Lachnospiraceae bacterium]|nr:hypothetical protein [Lachnospiraceae bacterium]